MMSETICNNCVHWAWDPTLPFAHCRRHGVRITRSSSCELWTPKLDAIIYSLIGKFAIHTTGQDVIKVFEHGATKHPDIAPTHEHLAHAIEHHAKYRMDPNWKEKESGLPHHAHVTARLILALYRHINDVEGRDVNATTDGRDGSISEKTVGEEPSGD